ncbi:MAG: cupin domain-containing protein [Actinobacteria bacterium]|nr:cupin domain-containing protein [Actinomycetota bacterium]
MIGYDGSNRADLEPWGTIADLPNAKALDGNPAHSGRCDVGDFETRQMVGEWVCAPGKFEYTYAGDEFCTLLSGRVRLTNESGVTREFTAGDSFFAMRGEVLIWEVVEEVHKVFFEYNADNAQAATPVTT